MQYNANFTYPDVVPPGNVGVGNRSRLDSANSSSSGSSSSDGGSAHRGGKVPRRRSHRPRGCRGGSSRRGRNRSLENKGKLGVEATNGAVVATGKNGSSNNMRQPGSAMNDASEKAIGSTMNPSAPTFAMSAIASVNEAKKTMNGASKIGKLTKLLPSCHRPRGSGQVHPNILRSGFYNQHGQESAANSERMIDEDTYSMPPPPARSFNKYNGSDSTFDYYGPSAALDQFNSSNVPHQELSASNDINVYSNISLHGNGGLPFESGYNSYQFSDPALSDSEGSNHSNGYSTTMAGLVEGYHLNQDENQIVLPSEPRGEYQDHRSGYPHMKDEYSVPNHHPYVQDAHEHSLKNAHVDYLIQGDPPVDSGPRLCSFEAETPLIESLVRGFSNDANKGLQDRVLDNCEDKPPPSPFVTPLLSPFSPDYRAERIEKQRQQSVQGGSLFVTSPRSFLLGWNKTTAAFA